MPARHAGGTRSPGSKAADDSAPRRPRHPGRLAVSVARRCCGAASPVSLLRAIVNSQAAGSPGIGRRASRMASRAPAKLSASSRPPSQRSVLVVSDISAPALSFACRTRRTPRRRHRARQAAAHRTRTQRTVHLKGLTHTTSGCGRRRRNEPASGALLPFLVSGHQREEGRASGRSLGPRGSQGRSVSARSHPAQSLAVRLSDRMFGVPPSPWLRMIAKSCPFTGAVTAWPGGEGEPDIRHAVGDDPADDRRDHVTVPGFVARAPGASGAAR